MKTKWAVILLSLCMMFSLTGVITFAGTADTADSGVYALQTEDGVDVEPMTADQVPVDVKAAQINGQEEQLYKNAKRFQVTISNTVDQKYYLVIVTDENAAPTQTNTKYIDQKTSAGGSIIFDVYPSELTSGKTYYIFLSDNTEDSSGLVNIASFKYNVSSGGSSAEGWHQNSTGWWYRNADGTYPKDQWKKIDGQWYHFDSKGYRQTGWLKLNDTWYYFQSDGVMVTGWLKIGSDYYYFNSNGSMAKDTWVGNYYLTSSGKMARDTWIGDKYVDASGKYDPTKVKEGWVQNSTGWWYRNADGSYPKDAWKKIDGQWYHFDSKGYRQTGWLKIDNTWYYFQTDGVMVTGWLKIGSDYYYFNTNGSMAKDTWVGNYYLASSGKMARDTWIGDKYVDSTGKYDPTKVKEGWVQNSAGWWYRNADGTYPKNAWKKIDGNWYHFNDKGYRQTGWLKLNDTWYYFKTDGVMGTGWLKIGSDYYYFNTNGSMAKNTWVGNYYLTSSGKMARDTWVGDKYVDSNGKYDPTKVK